MRKRGAICVRGGTFTEATEGLGMVDSIAAAWRCGYRQTLKGSGM